MKPAAEVPRVLFSCARRGAVSEGAGNELGGRMRGRVGETGRLAAPGGRLLSWHL